jgi:hypothetical protein
MMSLMNQTQLEWCFLRRILLFRWIPSGAPPVIFGSLLYLRIQNFSRHKIWTLQRCSRPV